MALTLAQVRTFVREHLDVDVEELSDSLIDRFVADAEGRIEAYSRNYTFRAVQYAFDTTADQQAYTVTGDVDVDLYEGIDKRLQDVTEIRSDRWQLAPVDHRQARSVWRADTTDTGTPVLWSQWGDDIYLWPTPDSEIEFTILGYRVADDLVDEGSLPDFPSEFHELIAWWALQRGYAQQDDPEMADFYRGEFETQLRKRAERYTEGNYAQPLRLNSGWPYPYPPWRLAHMEGFQ